MTCLLTVIVHLVHSGTVSHYVCGCQRDMPINTHKLSGYYVVNYYRCSCKLGCPFHQIMQVYKSTDTYVTYTLYYTTQTNANETIHSAFGQVSITFLPITRGFREGVNVCFVLPVKFREPPIAITIGILCR